MSENFRREFLQFALDKQVLKFGEFETKAGRLSPYFFNAGIICDGAAIARLGHFYARSILEAGLEFDMLFGPAYKGIVLAAVTAVALAQAGRNVPFAYNRKEAKDHGEGGVIVGAPLAGRVLIIDDVISAGTSVGQSVALIEAAGAQAAGVAIALDRMERGSGSLSAAAEVRTRYQMPVAAIATLDDLLALLENDERLAQYRTPVEQYRARYGA